MSTAQIAESPPDLTVKTPLDHELEQQSLANEQDAHKKLRAAIAIAANVLNQIRPNRPPPFKLSRALATLVFGAWRHSVMVRFFKDDPIPPLPLADDLPNHSSAKRALDSLYDWSRRTLDRLLVKESARAADRADNAAIEQKATDSAPTAENVPGTPTMEQTHKEKYSFERNGDQWKIQFREESTSLNHEEGMAYVAQLLKNPNRTIPALQLEGAIGKTARVMGEEYGDDLTIQKQRDAPAGDEELLKGLRAQLHEFDLELAERTKEGDEKECEIITRKKTDFLRTAKRQYAVTEANLLGTRDPIKGRGPRLSGGNVGIKAFDRVKYHIGKIKKKIAKADYNVPGFARHIRTHIREYGHRTGYVYNLPSDEIVWVIS
jgi:hypothetical protein